MAREKLFLRRSVTKIREKSRSVLSNLWREPVSHREEPRKAEHRNKWAGPEFCPPWQWQIDTAGGTGAEMPGSGGSISGPLARSALSPTAKKKSAVRPHIGGARTTPDYARAHQPTLRRTLLPILSSFRDISVSRWSAAPRARTTSWRPAGAFTGSSAS